jgi:hypothetical protein
MWPFIGLTIALFLGLSLTSALMKREEIKANWSKYKDDLLYMFVAFLFKPDDDPRSPVQFATDNFKDVMSDKVSQMFAIFLQPVFTIFKLFTDALMQTLNGLFNIKSLLGNMWNKWNDVFGLFMRRFYGIMNQSRLTFIRLFSSFERVYGIAVSSIYKALSLIQTIQSFMDLMIIVAIAILVILLAILIFLFLFMWPLIPVILLAIGVIAAAGFGGAIGGMGDAFGCFVEGTPVQLADGTSSPIEKVGVGAKLATGGHVLGIMAFEKGDHDLYDLYGVQVSGSHIVYNEDGTPCNVCDHPDAEPLFHEARVYCLVTTDQRIPIVTAKKGVVLFADWEEISQENTEALHAWHKHVFTTLNPNQSYVEPMPAALSSEAVVSGKTHVWTPLGLSEIRSISPGTIVMDAEGKPTRVLGIVRMDSSAVKHMYKVGENAYISAGSWMSTEQNWTQPTVVENNTLPPNEDWYNLFTESGTFKLSCAAVRDFSDVGKDRIHETYKWVLQALSRGG